MRFKAALCIIVALTILEFRTLWQLHRDQEYSFSTESEMVADGTARRRPFQSRPLGPLIIRATSHLTGATQFGSYELFTLVTMLAANLLTYSAGSRMTGDSGGAWAVMMANVLAFLLFQDWNWLYPWDFIDAITMAWLAYLIWARVSLGWFWLVFVAELFNREAAGYIGLWLMVDAGADLLVRPSDKRWGKLLSGVGMVAITIIVTHVLRAHWSPPAGLQDSTVAALGGQEWHLGANLYNLVHPNRPTAALPVFILIGFICAMARACMQRRRNAVRISLWVGGVIAITVMFALVMEARVWISVMPLILPLLFAPIDVPSSIHTTLGPGPSLKATPRPSGLG